MEKLYNFFMVTPTWQDPFTRIKLMSRSEELARRPTIDCSKDTDMKGDMCAVF